MAVSTSGPSGPSGLPCGCLMDTRGNNRPLRRSKRLPPNATGRKERRTCASAQTEELADGRVDLEVGVTELGTGGRSAVLRLQGRQLLLELAQHTTHLLLRDGGGACK